MATAATAPAPTGRSLEPVNLAGRYEILPGTPLPSLDGPGGAAFTVRALRDRKMDVFARVGTLGVPARMDLLSGIRGIEHVALMRMIEWGMVDWPADGMKRIVFILENPGGRRLMNSLNDTRDQMTEEQITRAVIQPLVSALRELSSRGIVHGDVRPTNIFLRDQGTTGIMLGECVSAVTSFGQAPLLLTVERAMAQPSGRGVGSTADDLYALGITILLLFMGRNPVRQLDDEAMLQAKIDKGPYPALVGTSRISLNLMEPLRGLLADDPKLRWTLNDLELWLSGRRLSPRQPQVPRKASRPFELAGTQYWHCRGLARAFARNSATAAPLIDNGELDRWLRRSLGDEATAEAVASAVDSAGVAGRGANFEDRLVSRVCMALDPAGPIRYKQKSVMVDGFGAALADAFIRNEGYQALGEAISAQLPSFWVNMQPEFKAEHVPLVQAFDGLRTQLERLGSGYGIERVLYELNPMMPCYSAMIRNHMVTSASELLSALEEVAGQPGRPREPMDRHIAAFLIARYRKLDERLIVLTTPGGEELRRIPALLNVLADVQNRFGPASLPNLCAWMVELMGPVIERFHSRAHREKLQNDATRMAQEGNLAILLKLIDDPAAIRKDEFEYAKAKRQFQLATHDVEKLKREISDRDEIMETSGRQVAAIISSVVSTIAVVGIVVYRLMLR
jgi:eukaryotic-like serine/threonine-protein kinase